MNGEENQKRSDLRPSPPRSLCALASARFRQSGHDEAPPFIEVARRFRDRRLPKRHRCLSFPFLSEAIGDHEKQRSLIFGWFLSHGDADGGGSGGADVQGRRSRAD